MHFLFFEIRFDCVDVNMTFQVRCLFLNENFLLVLLLVYSFDQLITMFEMQCGAAFHVLELLSICLSGFLFFSLLLYLLMLTLCSRIRFSYCWIVCLHGTYLNVYYSMTLHQFRSLLVRIYNWFWFRWHVWLKDIIILNSAMMFLAYLMCYESSWLGYGQVRIWDLGVKLWWS